MRRILIGTGYFATKENWTKKRHFLSLWRRFNLWPIREMADLKIAVVDNSQSGALSTRPMWEEYGIQSISVDTNLGHVHDFLNHDTPQWGGWSMSWMITAMIAYSEQRDFIYIEQDCLCFGDWFGTLMQDRRYNSQHPPGEFDEGHEFDALIGTHDTMPCEQSLFWVRHGYIPEFLKLYLEFQGDGMMLPEAKFRMMLRHHRQHIWFHSLGVGRQRPWPETGPFYVQQLTDPELRQVLEQHESD